MVSKAHASALVQIRLAEPNSEALKELRENVSFRVPDEVSVTVDNIAQGVLSPLKGFMVEADYKGVINSMQLSDDTPWTIPILLRVPESLHLNPHDEVTLLDQRDSSVAAVEIEEQYAQKVFGTKDPAHPGVAKVLSGSDLVAGGRLKSVVKRKTSFDEVTLSPKETRVLFNEKGWKDIIAFQTRNAPHIGHEYVQKMSLLQADGLFINSVLGKKKPGDFRDEVIVEAYKALLKHYYLKNSAVMSALHYEMQYAGPREAIMHAIMRKNFGCTKIAIGRDHAGVVNYYGPYAVQELFKEFPDLGIETVPMKEFYYCMKCGGIANERICPHPEVEEVILKHTHPFVE